MNHPVPAVGDNIHFLEQGVELLRSIDPSVYTYTDNSFKSGIGAHLRHCLDHYESFLCAYRGECIDYDHRERDTRIEEDAGYAAGQLQSIIDRLGQLGQADLDRSVAAKMDCGSEDPHPTAASSVKRELQFLVSHTVHHYALIALQLKQQAIEPHVDFGVAPSTIRHRSSSEPMQPTSPVCAR